LQEKSQTLKKPPYGTSISQAEWAIDVLKMPMNENTFLVAMVSGALDVVMWIRSNLGEDFPWSQLAWRYAAEGSHLHVLQWARAQNPPCNWDYAE